MAWQALSLLANLDDSIGEACRSLRAGSLPHESVAFLFEQTDFEDLTVGFEKGSHSFFVDITEVAEVNSRVRITGSIPHFVEIELGRRRLGTELCTVRIYSQRERERSSSSESRDGTHLVVVHPWTVRSSILFSSPNSSVSFAFPTIGHSYW